LQDTSSKRKLNDEVTGSEFVVPTVEK